MTEKKYRKIWEGDELERKVTPHCMPVWGDRPMCGLS